MDKKAFSINEINYIIAAIESARETDDINKAELINKIQKQFNGIKR